MNILGNGVDIIENKRISNSLKNRLFLYRIFTDTEISISKKIKNKNSFFAKRFAAKEAFVKALGTGFRDNINYRDISIINNKKGKPLINLSKNLKNYLKNKLKIKKYKVHLSLSDEKKHSIAFVIINTIK